MITLNIPASEQALIEQACLHSGMTIEQFLLNCAHEKALQLTATTQKVLLTDLLKGLPPADFSGDPVEIQRELRDEWN